MNRQPVYHRDNPNVRVIYRPHSQWVVQRLSERKSAREYDPWMDIGPAKDSKDGAVSTMYLHYPLKPT